MMNKISPLHLWSRRDWIMHNAAGVVASRFLPTLELNTHQVSPDHSAVLVQTAVDAARRAGAQYADARITHTMIQSYSVREVDITEAQEMVGIGIRALVNGAWGFTAVPSGERMAVERLAEEAVAQARVNSRGEPQNVTLGTISPATGSWGMPVKIDPFTVSLEEKLGFIQYWQDDARHVGIQFTPESKLYFIRQQRTVATSDGAHFTQTVYESGGTIYANDGRQENTVQLRGFTPAGVGWEMALDADVPGQLRMLPERIAGQRASRATPKPAQVGRYTLVCDGGTMAALLDRTIGVATQLDRAMGYEANASGTSFLHDPLTMLGTFKIASPLVNVTANRSVPGQLATVKWDAEGVEPVPFTLVKDGILVDYQTTREQAAWLASYYERGGQPVISRGCAAVENALRIPMQHMPNLVLTPGTQTSAIDDLVAGVTDGILITNGVTLADFQARTGRLMGNMHEIKNGKVGHPLVGGVVLYDTLDLWRNVVSLGDASTTMDVASTVYPHSAMFDRITGQYPVKGEPPQKTSYTVQAVAATITKQALIDPRRKA